MNPDIHLVIKLQGLDIRIGDLEKEVASLPKHIAQIEKALDAHLRRLEADRAALLANQKERKKLEGEIQIQEQKISKLRDQTLQAKTNQQYRAFSHEVEYCQQEIRKAEDRILDLMGAAETLEVNVKTAESALKKEQVDVQAEQKQARERTAVDEKQLRELRQERDRVVAGMRPELYSRYGHVRRKWKGTVVAEAKDGRCSECQIILRPQHFQDVRKGDQILLCESCGRILYYNPPIDVEAEMAGGPAR